MNPMYSCRHFHNCNVPICPLDTSNEGERLNDEHEKCHLKPETRRRLRRKFKTS